MPPRFFKHGELPLVLIALVDQSPRHGYEIMAELKRLFGPRYRPSPGSIYPAMEALQQEGLIEGQAVSGKVVYRPTPLGRQALADRAEMLAAVELRSGVVFGEGESLDALLTRFKARLSPLSGRVDPLAAEAVLERAAEDIESLEPSRSQSHKGRKSHAR